MNQLRCYYDSQIDRIKDHAFAAGFVTGAVMTSVLTIFALWRVGA